ncbi:MAG TPA: hypothetical protein VFU02_23125 [Polyangiaceae bacterium]|nr:hypothetical protein [Polyangiaceae bacterium]
MSDLKQIAKNAVARCPHCGNVTGLELSADLYYRCRICGGPRVPTRGEHPERSMRERDHLVKARRSQRAAWLFRALWIASGVVGGFTFLATLLTLLVFSGIGTAWASLLIFGAIPLLVAFWARRRTLRARADVKDELDLAWASVAHELLRASPSELTSAQLAELMLTDERHADLLLARLNVDDQVHSRVTDEGQVTYSVRATERFRVGDAPFAEDDWADDAEQHREAQTRRSE